MAKTDRERLIDGQVEELCENFGDYLAVFNRRPLYGDTLTQHKEMLKLRDKLGGVAKSIESDEYLRDLRAMLVAWGMDKRRAELLEDNEFADSIRSWSPLIVKLERVGLAQMEEKIAGMNVTTQAWLWMIIRVMELSQTQSQTVTVSKALHHLLPQLMPPIDGQYTGKFFHYQSSQLQSGNAISLMLGYFGQIARDVDDLGQYVGAAAAPWATSESKVIDNAIIGYCRKHRDMPKGIKKAYEWWMQRPT